jgi:hypothetical protein
MFDRLTVGDRTGILLPASCCWIALPASSRLRALRIAEARGCSAIGGPVGRFAYEGGKLWLTGLERCGGLMPLQEVYPELGERAVADWLSGTFHAKLDWLCSTGDRGSIFGSELTLTVEYGVVIDLVEKKFDKSSC